MKVNSRDPIVRVPVPGTSSTDEAEEPAEQQPLTAPGGALDTVAGPGTGHARTLGDPGDRALPSTEPASGNALSVRVAAATGAIADAVTTSERFTEGLTAWAARQRSFDPKEGVRLIREQLADVDTLTLAQALSRLRNDCTVSTGPDGEDRWEMRHGPRADALKRDPPAMIAGLSTPITQALAGEGRYAPAQLDALIDAPADRDALLDVVGDLERAGPSAPGHDRMLALAAVVDALDASARSERVLSGKPVAHAAALAHLSEALDAPQTSSPLQTALLAGAPGAERELLLEQVIRAARDGANPALVRLDLSRPSLPGDSDAHLVMEVSRFVDNAFPREAANLHRLRRSAAFSDDATELLKAMAALTEASGRSLLVVVDGLEHVEPTDVPVTKLFEQLDRLAEAGIPLSLLTTGSPGTATDVAARVKVQATL